MIFSRLAKECGYTIDQVLDMTPRQTMDALMEPKDLLKDDDDVKEMEIRDNLKYYFDRRILRLKYEKQLEEHLKKTAETSGKIREEFKKRIVARISNG